jgi:DNA-binding cell septation regulator SpoVG
MSASPTMPSTGPEENCPVDVVSIRRVDVGSLRAAVRIRVGNLVTIDHCKILETDDGIEWLALPLAPSRRTGAAGSGWRQVLEFDPGVWPSVRDRVLEIWRDCVRDSEGGR